jgi:hypoxanthine phosphoribosyltransferase
MKEMSVSWSEMWIDVSIPVEKWSNNESAFIVDEIKKSQQSLQKNVDLLKTKMDEQERTVKQSQDIQEGFRLALQRLQTVLRAILPSKEFPLPGEAQRRRMG